MHPVLCPSLPPQHFLSPLSQGQGHQASEAFSQVPLVKLEVVEPGLEIRDIWVQVSGFATYQSCDTKQKRPDDTGLSHLHEAQL